MFEFGTERSQISTYVRSLLASNIISPRLNCDFLTIKKKKEKKETEVRIYTE